MNLFLWPIHEIIWYGFWWLPLIAIAYCSTRYLGWPGFFLGTLLASGLIVILDVRWIFDEMREHPRNGRDADFVFWFGTLCRITLFNLVLLPIAIIGLKLRARRSRVSHDPLRRNGAPVP
jgi:hypothetical protein